MKIFNRNKEAKEHKDSLFTKYKKKKDLKTPVNIVINSEIDYKNHAINVLKTCLGVWSNNDDINLPSHATYFKYDWIYTDYVNEKKMYFLRTTKGELIRHGLGELIDNPEMNASSYMPTNIQDLVYTKYDRNAA